MIQTVALMSVFGLGIAFSVVGALKLELVSADPAKKREYTSWNRPDAGVRLVDNQENACATKSFAGRGLEIDGQLAGGKASLDGDRATSDVLLFEKPSPDATRLRLELPAAAFGEVGSVKFEIPMAMITVETDAEEKPEKIGAMSDERVATQEPAMADEDDGGPIAIPGMTDEPSMDEEDASMEDEDDGFSFSDDPKLQKAGDDLRRQRAEKDRADRSGNRKK